MISCEGLFPAQKTLRFFWVLLAFLGIAHVVNVALGWPAWIFRYFFDLDREANIPTWFSSFLWIVCFLTAYQCYGAEKRKSNRLLWGVAAAGLLGFSLDEVAMIHERVGVTVNHCLQSHRVQLGVNHSCWAFVLAPVLFVGGWFAIKILKRLFKDSPVARGKVFLGTAVVIFGTVLFDGISNFINPEKTKWLFEAEIIFEEMFEIAGVIIFLNGLILQRDRLYQPGV